MKTLLKSIVPLALVMGVAGCSKLPEETNAWIGKEIRFDTSVTGSEDVETKLVLKFWDSWVYPAWEDGDQVKIAKKAASGATGEALYNRDQTNDRWNAVSAPLMWAENAPHDFCVVYPSAGEVTFLSTPDVGSDPVARVQCEITRNMSNGDPKKFYMVGVSHVDEPKPQMQFSMTPAVSVFRFSITNKYAAGLRIASVNLLAWDEPYWTSESKQMYIYGKYYVDVDGSYDGWVYQPFVTYAGLAETPAYKSMTPGYVKTMAMNETASFTVYAIPQNYKRLVLTLKLTGAVEKEQKIDFRNTSYPYAGFDPFKKYDLKVTLQ